MLAVRPRARVDRAITERKVYDIEMYTLIFRRFFGREKLYL